MARNGSPDRGIPDFDETFDVIVIGFGFAGAFSAIHAADASRRVLLAEKQAVPGGISICSYGSTRCARSADDAFAYLKATNAGRTPEDVLRVLADGMTGIEQPATFQVTAGLCKAALGERRPRAAQPPPQLGPRRL